MERNQINGLLNSHQESHCLENSAMGRQMKITLSNQWENVIPPLVIEHQTTENGLLSIGGIRDIGYCLVHGCTSDFPASSASKFDCH
ncbi:hypothetical protein D3C75_1069480 [compost metagenome]